MAPITKQIGDHLYGVEPLPAMRAFILQPKIAPAMSEVARAISQVIGSRNIGLLMVGDTDVLDAIGACVTKFCETLPPKELEAITRDLLWSATRDNIPLFTSNGDTFDVVMRGHTMDVWKLLYLALEANYPDFFDVIGGFVKKLQAASPSEESSTLPPASPATV